jgi:hypothetical protein
MSLCWRVGLVLGSSALVPLACGSRSHEAVVTTRPSVGRGHDPCRPIQRRSEVVSVAVLRRAGVQTMRTRKGPVTFHGSRTRRA